MVIGQATILAAKICFIILYNAAANKEIVRGIAYFPIRTPSPSRLFQFLGDFGIFIFKQAVPNLNTLWQVGKKGLGTVINSSEPLTYVIKNSYVCQATQIALSSSIFSC